MKPYLTHLRSLGAALTLSSLLACGGSSSGPTTTPTPAPAPAPSGSFTVASSAMGPGAISPTTLDVANGSRASFTITPASGYQVASAVGCGGSLSGGVYTTGVITAGCTVAVRFGAIVERSNWEGVPQAPRKSAAWNFDFVEEFDDLDDWNLSAMGRIGDQVESTNLDRMPRLKGGRSAWGYFSLWSHLGPTDHAWIGGREGGRQVWRGSKSASIDLGNTGKGPSRLGLFLGDTGYRDFSVFYMVWIPKNMFPTSCKTSDGVISSCSGGGPTGYYEERSLDTGELLPYRYFASWKFNTFNVECNSADCSEGGSYGVHHTVVQIKQYNYAPSIGLVLLNSNHGGEFAHATDAKTTLNDFMGQWWGVEFRIRNNESNTAYTMDIWMYDQAGNSQHVLQNSTYPVVAAAHGGYWDQFFFGGNNANSWSWGDTMQSHYYIDDFIIDAGDKGRIGPRYFAAIRAQ